LKRLTNENFENTIEKEKSLFIIKFFSPSCGPCRTMNPIFEALDTNNPYLNVFEIDTMESPELAAQFEVRGVPYTVYCENREVLYAFTGTTPLGNLQYVINNIDDPYFRETGEFKQPDQKANYTFQIIVGLMILCIILAITLA
jgi:thioredoxin 1